MWTFEWWRVERGLEGKWGEGFPGWRSMVWGWAGGILGREEVGTRGAFHPYMEAFFCTNRKWVDLSRGCPLTWRKGTKVLFPKGGPGTFSSRLAQLNVRSPTGSSSSGLGCVLIIRLEHQKQLLTISYNKKGGTTSENGLCEIKVLWKLT